MRRIHGSLALPLLFVAACVGGYSSASGPDGGDPGADGGSNNVADGSSKEASTTAAPLYYGACLPQLAFGDVTKVLNFLVERVSQNGLGLQMTALRLSPSRTPPPTVSAAGMVGASVTATDPTLPSIDLALGTVTIPPEANPLSGSQIVIENARLVGTFDEGLFCAKLSGDVTAPVTLTLEPDRNICRFVAIQLDDATPTFQASDFAMGSCP